MKFSEICPIWSKIMTNFESYNLNTRARIRANIRDESRCIVAEAWNWSREYCNVESDKFCKECRYLGIAFYYSINGEKCVLDTPMFKSKLKKFLRHFVIHIVSRQKSAKKKGKGKRCNLVKKSPRSVVSQAVSLS